MIWPDESVYTGKWVEETRHGDRTDDTPEGMAYSGGFRDGERSGQGRPRCLTGAPAKGHGAGMRHGEGVETLRNGLARWCTLRWDVIVWDSCTAAKAQETQGPQSNRR